MSFQKIKCNNTDYRKGFIEVTPGIHDNLINIESWDVDPSVDISVLQLGDDEFPENGVVGNTELELNIEEAKLLIKQLVMAVQEVTENNA